MAVQDDIKKLKKQRKALEQLARYVCGWLGAFDAECKRLNEPGCGKRLAALANQLELANDGKLHFDLGMSFRKIGNLKKARKQPCPN